MTDKEIDDLFYWQGYPGLFHEVQAERLTVDEVCWCLDRRDRRNTWRMIRQGFAVSAITVIMFALGLLLFSGCTPHQSHLWWDGFGPVENGWATTRESK